MNAGVWVLIGIVALIPVGVLVVRWPLGMFFVFEVLLFSLGLFDRWMAPIPYANLLKDGYLLALIVGGGMGAFWRGRRVKFGSVVVLGIGCIYAATMSCVVAQESVRALAALRFFTIYPALIVLAMLVAGETSEKQLKAFMWANCALFGAVCSFGIIDYLLHNQIAIAIASDREIVENSVSRSGITENAVVGTFVNRANMACVACLGFLLALGMQNLRRGWVHRLVLGVAAISLIALLLTFSRSGYVAIAVGTLIVTWRNRASFIYVACVVTVASLVIYLAARLSGPSMEEAVRTVDVTLSGRVQIWEEKMAELQTKLIGVGLGYFGKDLNADPKTAGANQGMGAVDSSYLLVLFEQGVQGIVLFLTFMTVVLMLLIRQWNTAVTMEKRVLAEVALSWFVAMAIMGVSTDMFHIVFAMVPLYWFIGFALQQDSIKDMKKTARWIQRH